MCQSLGLPSLPWQTKSDICIAELHPSITHGTVYPKKYAHGFVVLCFVVVMQSFKMNSHEVFIHIHQGCFAGTGAIVRLPQCQWSKPDGYGKISQCITTTKHSKAKTVCIFLGIYCICGIWWFRERITPTLPRQIRPTGRCYGSMLMLQVGFQPHDHSFNLHVYKSLARDQTVLKITSNGNIATYGSRTSSVNTLRPRQNGRHFPDDIFKCIFFNEKFCILIKIPLNFVPQGPINNIPELVQIMVRRRPGDKPLSEPMMVSLLTHICVTWPQC